MMYPLHIVTSMKYMLGILLNFNFYFLVEKKKKKTLIYFYNDIVNQNQKIENQLFSL